MNRPWMPLYIADYLADTSHLGALQSGAYLHLIMHYWQHSGLPTDDASLARIARMTPSEWKRNRGIIAAFFNEQWCHKRIAAELQHAAEVSDKRRASAQARHSKPYANAPAIAPAKPEQLDTHARTSSQPHRGSTEPIRERNLTDEEVEIVSTPAGKPWLSGDDDLEIPPVLRRIA